VGGTSFLLAMFEDVGAGGKCRVVLRPHGKYPELTEIFSPPAKKEIWQLNGGELYIRPWTKIHLHTLLL